MTHRQISVEERLEACCIELLSIGEHYFGREAACGELAKGSRGVIGKGLENSKNLKRIATQLNILENVFQALDDIAQTGMRQCEVGGMSINKGEIASPMELKLPRDSSEMFRRSILRGLFNAIRVRMPDKTMQSLRLGMLWFRSKDDPPRLDTPEIPA